MNTPRTLFEKIWSQHAIMEDGGQTLLYIDRIIFGEGSNHAFNMVREQGLKPRRPRQIFATPDHYTATKGTTLADVIDAERRTMIETLDKNTKAYGIAQFGLGDPRRGIQHIVATEQGLAQPGLILVCSNSHTSTQSAVGALAFSIGGELGHAVATQTVWQRKPKTMRINVEGRLTQGVTAKDIILAIIAKIGSSGAVGHAVEYAGSAISVLSLEARMTVCNMSIEAGARVGIIAPDEKTYDYLRGRPFAPSGAAWDRAIAWWRTLPTDEGATFDREVSLDVSMLEPMVTWGNSPADAIPISSLVPDPARETDGQKRANMERALDYMDLKPGMKMEGLKIDRVFMGSCTNSRIEDFRAAAALLRGRKIAVPTLVVPGSGLVKQQAEAEGLARIFLDAGCEWGEAGCSMCVSMNGDTVGPGERCASTSNRNYRGRQGAGSRTHLVSPIMAAAASVTGRLTDVRPMMTGG